MQPRWSGIAMHEGRMMPKKYLGQHFLKDSGIISRIIETADINKDDVIVEIGPGRGALTFEMAGLARRVIAIEVDHALFESLNEQAASYPNLTVIEADALKFPYDEIESRFKVVANLPYYISTPILFRLMEVRHKITSMVVMLQKEVAGRVVASPKSKDYGILSIAIQYYTIPAIAFPVPRNAFYPVPQVDSAVLRIIPREKVAVEVKNENLFWAIIKSAFSHRRKTLLNSLAMAGFSKEGTESILRQLDMNPLARPEDIGLEEWGKIADTLVEYLSEYHRVKRPIKRQRTD